MALISITDVKARREISKSLSGSNVTIKLDQAILDAEQVDLRKLIGGRLYADLSANPTSTTNGSYPDLLNGSSYTYLGDTYTHGGLKDVLIDFAYARYIMFSGITDTPFGFREKMYDDGARPSDSNKREYYSYIREIAFDKWCYVRDFLNRVDGTDEDYEYWTNPEHPLDNSQNAIVMNRMTLR